MDIEGKSIQGNGWKCHDGRVAGDISRLTGLNHTVQTISESEMPLVHNVTLEEVVRIVTQTFPKQRFPAYINTHPALLRPISPKSVETDGATESIDFHTGEWYMLDPSACNTHHLIYFGIPTKTDPSFRNAIGIIAVEREIVTRYGMRVIMPKYVTVSGILSTTENQLPLAPVSMHYSLSGNAPLTELSVGVPDGIFSGLYRHFSPEFIDQFRIPLVSSPQFKGHIFTPAMIGRFQQTQFALRLTNNGKSLEIANAPITFCSSVRRALGLISILDNETRTFFLDFYQYGLQLELPITLWDLSDDSFYE